MDASPTRGKTATCALSKSYSSLSPCSSGPVLPSFGNFRLHHSPTSSASSSTMSPSSSDGDFLFSLDRVQSPSAQKQSNGSRKRSEPCNNCMCSPQTHPNTFKCAYHKAPSTPPVYPRQAVPVETLQLQQQKTHQKRQQMLFRRYDLRKVAIKNSLVKQAEAEGQEKEKNEALLIQTYSIHAFQFLKSFKHRPSCLSMMSRAKETNEAFY